MIEVKNCVKVVVFIILIGIGFVGLNNECVKAATETVIDVEKEYNINIDSKKGKEKNI